MVGDKERTVGHKEWTVGDEERTVGDKKRTVDTGDKERTVGTCDRPLFKTTMIHGLKVCYAEHTGNGFVFML